MQKHLLILLFIALLFSCNTEKRKAIQVKMNEEAEKVMAQTTNGNLLTTDEITIRFVDELVKKEDVDKPIETKVFSFKPSIKGKTYWKTTSTLAFKPAAPLKFKKTYKGKLNFKKLKNQLLPDSLTCYVFEFNITGRAITAYNGDFVLKNSNNPKYFNFQAEISFSENTTLDEAKKCIHFKDQNSTINLNFEAKSDGRSFIIKSDEIIRDEDTHQYKFIVDKDILGLETNFEKDYQLTPVNNMAIVSVTHLTTTKNPKIRIEFSDELSSEQDLNGLITISPTTEFKLQKIGRNIMVDGDFRYGDEYKVTIHKGIKSRWATQTTGNVDQLVKFPDIDPQVEFTSGGVYLPSNNDYKIQFYSCNLQRVHIEIKKVYDKDLIEFLNSEKLNSQNNRRTPFENDYINRNGSIIHNETFEIDSRKNKWLLSEVDLSKIIRKHQKGLYLVRVNFNPRDMLVAPSKSDYDYIEENGQIYKPLIFSNIGLTCKRTGSNYRIWATDINTSLPLENVKVTLKRSWTYEKCEPSGTTNRQGEVVLFLPINCSDYFSYVIAEYNNEKSAIKFNEMEWNISGFDIGGIDGSEMNTQAFCYTERGVYRPGDEINFSVIARHRGQEYPADRALTVDLYNPQGKKVYTVTDKENKDGFYSFKFITSESDPTGNWKASFYIGNQYFSENIKIETIVPFRLKTQIFADKDVLYSNDKELIFNVESKYLFGTPAKDLEAEITAEITSLTRKFPKYTNFTFTNPTIDFNENEVDLFAGTLDSEGKVSGNYELPDFAHAPSAINLRIKARILEKGGRPNDISKDILINPYPYYLGIQSGDNYVKSGTDLDIPVILVDPNGNAVPGKTIKYRIFRNEKHWWWHYDNEQQLRYKTDIETILMKEGEIKSGKEHTILRFLPVENGTYFVEVSDAETDGHSAGFFFNAYQYAYSSESDNNAGSLVLRSDKQNYTLGEIAHISFPTPTKGNVLVSVEQSDQILSSKWYPTTGKEEMIIDFPITESMVPNVHISVSVIQPHAQTINDCPIRMFGVIPISVVNQASKFDVEIKTTNQFRPEEPFEISIQNSNRKKSQFTIAVVDEGLLDITGFKTPEPWPFFFRKLRLQVRTYDLFSQVISANLGDVFKTFAIGGDMDYRKSQLEPNKKKRRFEPVSLFQGPIETDDNGKATVKFDMPNYVGSVRIMVISANKNSYASAEKAVPVKKELMILPTLPRVIGPDEKFQLPVSVFAMIDNIGDVTVTVETDAPINIAGSKTQTIRFNKAEDKECIFNLFTSKAAGQSKVIITASNGKYSAKDEINLLVRPTSPRIFETTTKEVSPGNSVAMNIPARGIEGTNNASLTIAPFPGMNFSHRLEWLIHYPYGCIEQTTSSVFPQLYIKEFIKFPDAKAEEIDVNINAGIERLRRFQLFTGAFSYWPGNDEKSEWGTLYAGHFLVEAKKLGYYVPTDLYDNWLRHVVQQAKSNSGEKAFRTYQCYILALAGEAVISEMNQLMESELATLTTTQKWQLAAAYYLAGQTDVAKKISSQLSDDVKEYVEFSGTYGSALRDKAIILECKVAMKMDDKTTELIKAISTQLASTTWYSTQSLGYSITALGKYINTMIKTTEKPRIKGTVIFPGGKAVAFDDTKAVTIPVNQDFGRDIQIQLDESSTFKKLYTLLSWNGVPLESEIGNSSRNLELDVNWYNEDGILMDPSLLKQGSSFWAHFTVRNLSDQPQIDELALLFMLPSGWEVQNTRLKAEMLPDVFADLKLNNEEYLDIRDDRVMWFFDIHKWEPLLNEIDFVVKLNAVTVGEFTLPPVITEAMYNGSYKASVKGKKVRVVGLE